MEKKNTYTEQFAKERFNESEQWLYENLLYEVIMGSHAYGTQKKDSDFDIVCIVMNKHEHLFPQSYGYVLGFDQLPNFESKDVKGKQNRIILPNCKESEGEWNSLTRFFYLSAIKGSPNLIETLFARRHLVKYGHNVAWMLRDNRRLFLSMRTFHAFKGYAFSQFHRMKNERKRGKAETEERQYYLDNYGYDVKKGYHTLRLFDLVEQMLTEDDLDLMRNKEECKAMRRGEWGTWEDYEKYVVNKIDKLDRMSENGYLSNRPRLEELHNLLKKCIEEWYGSETEMKRHQTEYASVKMLLDRFDKMENKFDSIVKNK